MLTDDDIIRILSDPRFRRTVRAICRLAFTDKDPEVRLSENHGMITDEEACAKYGISPDELYEAINNRWIRAEANGLIDDDSVSTWIKGRPKFMAQQQAKAERQQRPRALRKPRESAPIVSGPEDMTLPEAAAYIGCALATVGPLASMGRLVRCGRGLVTRESVLAYRDRLEQGGYRKPKEPSEPVSTEHATP